MGESDKKRQSKQPHSKWERAFALGLIALFIWEIVSTPLREAKRDAPLILILMLCGWALMQLGIFLCIKDPTYSWEARAFRTINMPFHLMGSAAFFVLTLVYRFFGFIGLPLLILIFAFNALWIPLAIAIRILAAIVKQEPYDRFLFLLALPVLVLAHFLVTISPIPSSTITDVNAKTIKLSFVENFPNSSFT